MSLRFVRLKPSVSKTTKGGAAHGVVRTRVGVTPEG